MKGKLFKASASAIALTVVLSGCGGSKEDSKGAASPSPSASSAASVKPSAAPAKAVEFSWIGAYVPGNDTLVQKYLEQKYNVKIKPIGIDRSNWQQQISIKLASGEKPDLFGNLDISYTDFLNYVKQGLIGELKEETIRKYMPNYSKMIDETDPTAWKTGVVDGKNYGIPKFYGEGGSPFLPMYNSDWLKKVGYNEPPKTLAELEDVLTKFRNNDPDGNGKKDTYGITARGKDTLGSNQIFNTVFAAYGANPGTWQVTKDGKVELGLTSENARAAFKTLNKWYKDGLIDPEFVTDDWNNYRAKFAGNKVGMADQTLWYHAHSSGQLGADAAKAGVNMVAGKPVVGPQGKMMGITQGYKQVPFGLGAETVKDENKVAAILKVLDGVALDPEAFMMVLYGEKGKHYDLVDGAPVPKGDFVDPIKAAATDGLKFFTTGSAPSMLKYEYSAEKQAFKDKLNDKAIVQLTNPVAMTVIPSWDANKDALTKLMKEYELKLIIGEVDTDKGFDTFVADMKKAGLDKATEEANALYAAIKK
ncbi:MAG: hypothetical protein J7639_14015 [Paenibacillaceae bacterium]|uniref:DUF3502 domain-containing protein n=1 Tax=Paenibacillus cymbidii TaxID=1639034 RepID=UPI0010821FAD|nr:DUF3502 domain-containing protein [Paenibacillus cymbidii]MBO9607071.1 hypothetical protein [Paenibacillaceae bacterium]